MSLPQPVPPSWKDLGKSSNDLLTKDYPFTTTALEVKTKTPSGVTFKVAGTQDNKTGVIASDVESKYLHKPYGLTYTQAWTTSNVLKSTVELDNTFAKGLKIDATSTLQPDKGSKSAVFNAAFKQSGFHTRGTFDLFKSVVTADGVVGRDGFLAGAEASYNINDGKVAKYAAAVGYNAADYAVTIQALNGFKTYAASYYHRVNSDVEAGAKAIYDSKLTVGGVALEVGGKTILDRASGSSLKAKINNSGVIALGYQQILRPGLKATFGLALDTQQVNEAAPVGPVHKVGASFVFES
ncbi:hypothetical protein CYLTODRAFT_379723 [Cylindrobasidium torrendii FP15055 ss-10]|uniref:Voltage-dependent ion-selective channel n=1 Tax=Cylindrobasidium torrendii FP15055 ss-10 TaxID=1314674 RepID=A0A0D7B6S3_9AGAR|nr:hypothetical protein CYLTODRAFT_379723 [Cylindrobasidium torrendii FP15055 ss-10]